MPTMTFHREQFLSDHRRLVAIWGDRLPEWSEANRQRADAALEGRKTGGPDNTLCARGPLDFLAAAFHAIHDERYAVAAREWLELELANAETALDAWVSLAISFTVGNTAVPGWLGTLPYFLASPAFDEAFVTRIVDISRQLLDSLHDRLTTENMNWRLAEADSLLLNGLRLACLPASARWCILGVAALNDAFHRQFLPDGVHVERNPHYHTWPLWMMDAWQQLELAWPELGIRLDVEKMARAWDYALGATRPNGDENGLHDSNGIRVGRTRNYAAELRQAFRERNGLPASLPPASQWFPDAGQAFLRDGWGEDATYLTFDASLWGGCHAHYSRNTVQVHAYRRTLLCEVGWLTETGTYSSKPIGAYSGSTRAHNTLNLNGWNQSQANPSRTRYHHCEGYDFVSSDYDGGYFSGAPQSHCLGVAGCGLWASHHRALLWVHGRAIVVIDSLFRQQETESEPDDAVPSLEANWQFCEGGHGLCLDGQRGRLTTTYPDANALMLFPLLPDGMQWIVREGQEDPVRGWVNGPVFQPGIIAAPQLTLSLPKMRDHWAELVTVIIPYQGTDCPRVTAEASSTAADNIGRLALRWHDGTVDRVEWYYRQGLMLGDKVSGYNTDASLVHRCFAPGGTLRQGAALDGTYVTPYTRDVLPEPALFRFA